MEQTLKPVVSVATIAQANGINANQVLHWGTLYEAGQLENVAAMSIRDADADSARLLPVTISEGTDRQARAAVAASIAYGACSPSLIEVTLFRGTVRIAGAVDTGRLRAVLGCLLA